MKIVIIYSSRGGTTKAYAHAISDYLQTKDHNVDVFPVDNYDEQKLKGADLVMLGGWTSGLFLFAQHPDRSWKEFAASMPQLNGKAVVLFTTYKLLTGSMYRRMVEKLQDQKNIHPVLLKSRNSSLTDENKKFLDELMTSEKQQK